MSALDDVLCCRGVADAVAADRGDTMLGDAVAELAALRAEVERLRGKAIRFDLDEHGIASRERDAVELVERRAEVERLRGVQSSLRDWAQGRVETLTRCIATEGIAPSTAGEMMYERTIMRDIVAMLDEATP
jgi:hypothetical protein